MTDTNLSFISVSLASHWSQLKAVSDGFGLPGKKTGSNKNIHL